MAKMFGMKQDTIVAMLAVVLIAVGAYFMMGGRLGAIGITTTSAGLIEVLSLDQMDYTAGGTQFAREWRANVMLGRGDVNELVAGITTFKNDSITLVDGTNIAKTLSFKYNIEKSSCSYKYEPGTFVVSKYTYTAPPTFTFTRSYIHLNQQYTVESGRCIPESEFAPLQIVPPVPMGALYGERTELETACNNNGGVIAKCSYVQWPSTTINGYKCAMVKQDTNSYYTVYPTISTASPKYSANVIITNASGASRTIYFGTASGLQCDEGKTAACVLEGDIAYIEPCPTSEVASVFYAGSIEQGRIVYKSEAIASRNMPQPGAAFNQWDQSETELQNEVAAYNNALYNKLDAGASVVSDFTTQADRTVLNDIYGIYMSWNTPRFYPKITTMINADWVGIVTPVSKPYIYSIDEPSPWSLSVGEQKTTGFTIANNGSTGAVFTQLKCYDTATVSSLTPSTSINLENGGKQYYSATILGTAVGTNGKCVITTCSGRDLNYSQECKSATINLNVLAAAVRPDYCVAPYYDWNTPNCIFLGCPSGYIHDPNDAYTPCKAEPEDNDDGCYFDLPENGAWNNEDTCDWDCKTDYVFDPIAKKCVEKEEEVIPEACAEGTYWCPPVKKCIPNAQSCLPDGEQNNTIYYLIGGVIVVAGAAYFLTQGKGGIGGKRRR